MCLFTRALPPYLGHRVLTPSLFALSDGVKQYQIYVNGALAPMGTALEFLEQSMGG
jgi:hypothetical protein